MEYASLVIGIVSLTIALYLAYHSRKKRIAVEKDYDAFIKRRMDTKDKFNKRAKKLKYR